MGRSCRRLIGPWSIKLPDVGILTLHARTSINSATGLAELGRIDNRIAAHVALCFEQMWLSRHTRPIRVIHGQGSEFIGANFQLQLHAWDIPPANAIYKRIHKTFGDQIRTLIHKNLPGTVETALDLVVTVLAAAQRALRITVNRTVGNIPGAMVFGRDMLLPISILTGFNLICQRREAVIDENNHRMNLRRLPGGRQRVSTDVWPGRIRRLRNRIIHPC